MKETSYMLTGDDFDGRFGNKEYTIVLNTPFDLDVEGAPTYYEVPVDCLVSTDFGFVSQHL